MSKEALKFFGFPFFFGLMSAILKSGITFQSIWNVMNYVTGVICCPFRSGLSGGLSGNDER